MRFFFFIYLFVCLFFFVIHLCVPFSVSWSNYPFCMFVFMSLSRAEPFLLLLRGNSNLTFAHRRHVGAAPLLTGPAIFVLLCKD